jgi:hypothetical protein
MNSTQFGNALEAHQSYQLGRYLDQMDEQDRFDAELEREQERLGKLTLDDALEELGLGWEDAIGSLKDRLIDVISNRTNDDY